MAATISVDRYVAAFATWARVANKDAEERAVIARGGAYIKSRFHGDVAIKTLCDVAATWLREHGRGYALDIGKSCLLSRLIYGGEDLRIRPCPIHGGRWSGCHPEECPGGCNYGINVTGWLPNDLVDEWPRVAADPMLDRLGETLRESWNSEHAAVYADRLLALGDPRGELITLELAMQRQPSSELAARHSAVLEACFGDIRARDRDELMTPRGLGDRAAVTLGFLDAAVTTPTDIRKIYASRNGRYLRRLSLRGGADAVRNALAMLAIRPHAWLGELAVAQDPVARNADYAPSDGDMHALFAAMPALATLAVAGRGVLANAALASVRRLRIDRLDSITLAIAPVLEHLEIAAGEPVDADAIERYVRAVAERAPELRQVVIAAAAGLQPGRLVHPRIEIIAGA